MTILYAYQYSPRIHKELQVMELIEYLVSWKLSGDVTSFPNMGMKYQ